MYFCQKSEPGVWAVGCYAENGEWTLESRWNSAAEAAEHMHRLNLRNSMPNSPEDSAPKQ